MVTYPDMASGAEFVDVFKMMIVLGAHGAPFLKSLQLAASRFVNPLARRLRLHAFSNAVGLPRQCPRLKIAVPKWSYLQDTNYGFCTVPDCDNVNDSFGTALREAEAVLHKMHAHMGDLVREEDDGHRTQWLGNVDTKVASVWFTAKSGASCASVVAKGPSRSDGLVREVGAASRRGRL